jgi:hypothetical protein
VLAAEAPRYRAKLWLRRALDLAPPNTLINAALMTAPMRKLAQRLYFHSRGDGSESFKAWSRAFEQEAQPAHADLRLV